VQNASFLKKFTCVAKERPKSAPCQSEKHC
jgi:hypothetical protein